jgi:hypothetical protein
MVRLLSTDRYFVVDRCSFHREPDGSDRHFCCQLHVSVSRERVLVFYGYTGANCEVRPFDIVARSPGGAP